MLLAACGSDSTPPTSTAGSITVSLSASTLSVVQGTNGTVTITVGRAGSFTGSVDLSLEGAPTGVAGAFTPSSVPGNATSSTLALTVASTVPAGNTTLTIRGKGTGVTDQTATVTLTVTAAAVPSFSLTLSPASLTIAQGANNTTTATIARAGGFTGAVGITFAGAPTGVTVAANPTSVTAATSTITVTVGAATTPGNYPITVTGAGTGVTSQNATLTLTVTQVITGNYTLALSPATVSVQQGASGASTLNLTRTGGFTGAVGLTSTGAPNGMTVTFNPTSVTGNSSAIAIAVGSGVATGNYAIVITGTSTGLTNQVVTLTVTVTAPTGGGNVTFSFCGAVVPIWLAAQDGAGAWTRITAGANNTYSFNIASGRGGVAYVIPQGTGFTTIFFYATIAELTGQAGTCVTVTPTGKTVNGSVAGVAASDLASITLGTAATSVTGGVTTFSLAGVPDGNLDLIAGRAAFSINGTSVSYILNKLIIRRGLNQAANSTLPVLDFGASEAFDPVAKTLTINGAGTDQVSSSISYVTSNGTNGAFYNDLTLTAGARTYYGVPAAKQAAGDLHAASVAAFPAGLSGTSFRTYTTWFKDAVDKTITLPPVLNAPTISVVATAPYVRLRAQLTVQAEYNKFGGASFTQGTGATTRQVSITATGGYLAGAFDFTIPDFSALVGWDNNWGLKVGAATQTSIFGYGWTTTGLFTAAPAEGGSTQFAIQSGTITP
jgi:hypothetical protein